MTHRPVLADTCCRCGADSRVVDIERTRTRIRRRRECVGCAHRWTTTELADESPFPPSPLPPNRFFTG